MPNPTITLAQVHEIRLRAAQAAKQKDNIIFGEFILEKDVPALCDLVDTLVEVLRSFVTKLDIIHADPQYMNVWHCAHNHIGPYRGPQYIDESEAARDTLASLNPQPAKPSEKEYQP